MHTDTLALLRDCAAGIDRAVSTMDALLPDISDRALRKKLQHSILDHRQLHHRTQTLLLQYGGRIPAPSAVSRQLIRLRTGTRMALGGDDTTAAYLAANGCDTGIKALSRSKNRYAAADTDAVSLTQQLIRCEEALSADLRAFL